MMNRDHDTIISSSDQDFAAALHEIKSNLEVRRLMFVVSNILIPALAIAMLDTLTGSYYPAPLAWLPLYILPLSGALLAVAGILITAILTRCHFGLVINGNKMEQVLSGRMELTGLNWLGVTTNFVALTAVYASAGLSLLLSTFELGYWALLASGLLFITLLLYLRVNHARANRLSKQLVACWQPGEISIRNREEHARVSLEATSSDISVIVVMAIALFSGLFNCMTNIGSISPDLSLTPSVDMIKAWGLPLLSGFTIVSLLLSARMVVRLRIALAQHSQQLAELRNEPDNPWQFRPQERTYLLFGLLHLLTSVSTLILVWTLSGLQWAIIAASVMLLAGLLWYPMQLLMSRQKPMDQPRSAR